MKSPLKWPGAKLWLSKKIERVVAEVQPQLVAEPFCGGASFSLYNQFEKVLANDNSLPLINFYRHLRGGLSYDTTQFTHTPEVYYSIRKKLNDLTSTGEVKSAEAARYFYYLNKQGYNGLVRVNKLGHSNVPIGRYSKVHPLTAGDLFKSVTKNWIFSQGCYSYVDISGVDLALSDPPYADPSENIKAFSNYSGRFGPKEQIEHLDWLADMNVPTIACNSANVSLAKEYKRRGFQVYKILAPRYISCKAGGRVKVDELLAFRGFGKSRKFGSLIDGARLWRV